MHKRNKTVKKKVTESHYRRFMVNHRAKSLKQIKVD